MMRLLHSLWQSFKMNRAMRESSTGDTCVACDGSDVTLVAPQAYRCNACGYEGGDGWAAHKQAQRHATFAQMDPAQRRETAKADLLEARTLLTSGIGDISRASSLSTLDMVGLTGMTYGDVDGEGHEKHNALTAGIGLLLEAKQKAVDAQAKLGVSLGVAATAEGGGTTDAAAALDLHFDSLLTDILVHRDISRTLNEANAMLHAVNSVLRQQFQV